MKTTDLRPGQLYRLSTGQTVKLLAIFGRGRNRQVRLDCKIFNYRARGPGRWMAIKQFAELAVEALGDVIEPFCRECGCTENDACYHDEAGPCSWTEPDLCSLCAYQRPDTERPADRRAFEDELAKSQ